MLPKIQPNLKTGLPCVAKSPAAKNCLVAVFLGIPVIFSQCLFVIITWGHVPLGVLGVLLLCLVVGSNPANPKLESNLL
jgi:hypothetical protein